MRKIMTIGGVLMTLLLIMTACGNQEDPGDEGYTDGVYSAVSTADQRGYAWAEVTISQGRITNVQLQDFDGLGQEKDWDVYPYSAAKEALDELETVIVEGNTADVDIVTGATASSQNAIEAVKHALEKADPSAPDGTYFDGTFMGISTVGARGWGIAWVTLKDDEITAVKLLETMPGENGRFVLKAAEGDDRYDYEPYHTAREQLAEDIVQSGSTDVDAVSGATGSSTNFVEAVEHALEQAER